MKKCILIFVLVFYSFLNKGQVITSFCPDVCGNAHIICADESFKCDQQVRVTKNYLRFQYNGTGTFSITINLSATYGIPEILTYNVYGPSAVFPFAGPCPPPSSAIILTGTQNSPQFVINNTQIAGGGWYLIELNVDRNAGGLLSTIQYDINAQGVLNSGCTDTQISCENCVGSFAPEVTKKYMVSAWCMVEGSSPTVTTYTTPQLIVALPGGTIPTYTFTPAGAIIDGWQRIEGMVEVTTGTTNFNITLNSTSGDVLFDDLRVFPFDGSMKTYVYDPKTLRLAAELDERNYATIYEYDEEGKLIRVKKETERGIMTIQENKNNMKKQ